MIAVESASVPSQSKTSSRNCRGAETLSIAGLRFIEARDEAREIWRQRRLDGQQPLVAPVRQGQTPPAAGKPPSPLFCPRPRSRQGAPPCGPPPRETPTREGHAGLGRAP